LAELLPIATTLDARAHVILVHGLGGHPIETFQRDKDSIETFWPNWLAEDIGDINVWSIAYEAPPTNFTGSALDLQSRALTFYRRLTLDQRINNDLPIIFVCHSLGGLIIKQLMRLICEQKSGDAQIAKALRIRIRAIAFYATPHTGASLANWASWFRIVVNRSQSVMEMTKNNPLSSPLQIENG
jgi:triacylglycerol esterase/lipase EstA (alpha/beta hydrolase family)